MKSYHKQMLFLLAFTVIASACWADEDPYTAERQKMVSEIEADVKLTSSQIKKRSLSGRVMEAMGKVERHEFVPDPLRQSAYQNRPLPIGYGQTISQPYIVALMTDLIDIKDGARVLEIGAGSGYQAAILAECGAAVYTLEIIPELAELAEKRLKRLGYSGIEVRVGDGYYGWPEHSPYDAIIVTAAASHVPPPLLAQLKPGGKMVIPVGGPFMTQHLLLVEKGLEGKVTTRQILPVLFVPLTGGH